MKIIVPMAGRGSRLRPHTLTIPKPLIPVAGKPIVHRLVMDIAKVLDQEIEEIAFILGDPAFFGEEVVESLKELAKSLGAKPSIYRQLDPKGTGHAIMCAEASLSSVFLSNSVFYLYRDPASRSQCPMIHLFRYSSTSSEISHTSHFASIRYVKNRHMARSTLACRLDWATLLAD